MIAALILGPQSRAESVDPAADEARAKTVKVLPGKKRHRRAAVRATHHARPHHTEETRQSGEPNGEHHSVKTPRQVGLASWYGVSRSGRRTASGERLDDADLTAAHLTLPMHSRVRVTNLENGKSVTVRVTDRGPHLRGRIIDVSKSAAELLDMKRSGIARVEIVPLPSKTAASLLAPAESGDAGERSRSASAALGTGLAY